MSKNFIIDKSPPPTASLPFQTSRSPPNSRTGSTEGSFEEPDTDDAEWADAKFSVYEEGPNIDTIATFDIIPKLSSTRINHISDYLPSRRKNIKKTEKKEKQTKTNASTLRILSDIEQLDEELSNVKWHFDPDNLHHVICQIKILQGLWKDGLYHFHIKIPDTYPIHPPKIKIDEKIYHPNINDSQICLNILGLDMWKPHLDLQQILHGLLILFQEPNADDAFNLEIGKLFKNDYNKFQKNVEKSMRGETVDGIKYPDFSSMNTYDIFLNYFQ